MKVDYTMCGAAGGPDWRAATEDQTSAILRLDERLADLQSWLPASGWEDQTIRAYVPSPCGICLVPSDPKETGPITTVEGESAPEPDPGQLIEQLLSLLRASAAEVLRGSETVLDDVGQHCLVVTTDEARLLDQALSDEGAELFGKGVELLYHLDYPGEDGAGVGIMIQPPASRWVDLQPGWMKSAPIRATGSSRAARLRPRAAAVG